MLKRFLVVLLLIAIVIVPAGANLPANASEVPIKMVLNGKTLVSDVAPVIQNGRTLVPFRVIFEALGAKVEWNAAINQVAGYTGPLFVLLNPGSTAAWVTGKLSTLDVGPVIISGRTMVPLRFVAEALGAQVEWQAITRTVAITYAADPIPTPKRAGNFNTVYSGELTTLNYLVTATTAEQAIAANIIDGLIEFDHLGILHPSLAKSWKISPDGLVYTFTLREGVKW
ncbi:MAG: stalk domain-containing protein, partial [bacterium]|nr:stalk domain-containing protein [bacterium]